jgi:excisionase family DNA binding protein
LLNKLTPAEGWASKQETAKHLKISLGTLSHWMKKGVLPYVKIGKGVRFKLSQVDEAMNRQLRAEAKY